ncbi:MAG: hypothetical protein JSS31_07850 [Proteobacteria bacterium]|nr:hypothetical protein [Pseudomonadota bacterium]MBS0493863.1 hypothetical protein [Pseudomonadota bacterium]
MTEQIRSADLLVKTALSSPDILAGLKQNPEEVLKGLAKGATDSLPRVALQEPDTRTNNAIWLIVVIAFAAVMVGSAYVLGVGVNMKLDAGSTYVTKGETMLTVFTTVVAFLAGLLSPSPVKR